jgi:PST family polysaccharide transporter
LDAPETYGLTGATPPPGGQLTRASAATLAAAATAIVVGLIRSKLVALLLGPFGVGALANLSLYLNSATVIAAAAAGPGAVRALAAMRSGDQRGDRPWLERYLFVGPLIVGLLLTLISVAVAGPLSVLLLGQPDLVLAVLFIAAAILVAVMAASYTQLLQSLLRVGTIARADVVTTVISLPLTVVLVIAFGLAGGVVAVGAGFAVRLIALRLLSPGILPRGDWRRSLRVPTGALRPILAIGSGGAILGIATTLGALLVRAEIVRTLGLETSGLYQPVVALSDTYLDLVIGATSVYLFPRLTELLARGDRATSERELGHGLRLSLAVSMPVILVAVGLSDLVVQLLYSTAFGDAAWPLSIQMAGTMLKVVTVSAGVALLPLGMTRTWVLIGVLVVVLRYLGVVVLAPSLGLVGAALASDVAWAVGAIATLTAVHRSRRLSVARLDPIHAVVAGLLVLVVLVAHVFGGWVAVVATLGATLSWLVIARAELGALLTSLLDALRRRGKPGSTG